jgi:phage-related protein
LFPYVEITIFSLVMLEQRFGVELMPQAMEFLENLEPGLRVKLLYNMKKASFLSDDRLFKKLNGEIWEFRTRCAGLSIRMLAFWDCPNAQRSRVIVTHGFLKKSRRTPARELLRAEILRSIYMQQHNG